MLVEVDAQLVVLDDYLCSGGFGLQDLQMIGARLAAMRWRRRRRADAGAVGYAGADVIGLDEG